MPSLSKWTTALTVGLLSASHVQAGIALDAPNQALFDEGMGFMDKIYDRAAGYLYYFYYPLAAGPHETRSSVWYATGLLQRNKGDDVEQACKIIRNVIGDQEKRVEAQWFGDYTVYPEQPTVGTDAYPQSIYNSWDPNWRGFIGTNLMVIYEEFADVLPADVKGLILESMYNNTIGDSYRVGGVDDDNLFPSYSNPAIMRAVASGWTGRKMNDANMTAAGEAYAQEIIDLFNINDTLSEFQVPTYYGVSLYGLTLWAKYMPQDSLMGQNGARMVSQTWDVISEFYNPSMRNLAGPWDRNYGYDMNRYVAILSMYVWSLFGREAAWGPVGSYLAPELMAHADDFEWAPLIAVLAPFHNSLIPAATVEKLRAFPSGEERIVTRSTFAPPHDVVLRNVTTWLSENLTVGAESFEQTHLGGARDDPSAWAPAVVQWTRDDDKIGFFVFHPSEKAVQAGVGAGELNLTYPAGGAGSVFTFLVDTNPLGQKRDINGVEDIYGLNVEVSGTVDPKPLVGFCGLVGGTCSIIHGFEFWNLTFVMPPGSVEVPSVNFKFGVEGKSKCLQRRHARDI